MQEWVKLLFILCGKKAGAEAIQLARFWSSQLYFDKIYSQQMKNGLGPLWLQEVTRQYVHGVVTVK